jgi:hypothetical protein
MLAEETSIPVPVKAALDQILEWHHLAQVLKQDGEHPIRGRRKEEYLLTINQQETGRVAALHTLLMDGCDLGKRRLPGVGLFSASARQIALGGVSG